MHNRCCSGCSQQLLPEHNTTQMQEDCTNARRRAALEHMTAFGCSPLFSITCYGLVAVQQAVQRSPNH
jgi:hypothetical protein